MLLWFFKTFLIIINGENRVKPIMFETYLKHNNQEKNGLSLSWNSLQELDYISASDSWVDSSDVKSLKKPLYSYLDTC